MQFKRIFSIIFFFFLFFLFIKTQAQKKPRIVLQNRHDKSVNRVVYSYNSRWLASSGDDNTIKIWDNTTGKLLKTLNNFGKTAYGLIFHPEMNTLISSCGNKILIWDIHKGIVTKELKAHKKDIYTINFSKDGRWLISGGKDENIIVWDFRKKKKKTILKENLSYNNTIYNLIISDDGKYIFSSGEDLYIKMWNWRKKEIVKKFAMHYYKVNSMAINLQNNLLATASNDHTVKVWEIATGEEIAVLKDEDTPAQAVLFHPTKDKLIVGNYHSYEDKNGAFPIKRINGTLTYWDISKLKVIWKHKLSAGVLSLDLSPEGDKFVMSDSERKICVYDFKKGKQQREFGVSTRVNDIAIIKETNEILVAGDDGSVKVWSLNEGRIKYIIESDLNTRMTALAYNPKTHQLITANEDIVQIWNFNMKIKNFQKINAFNVPGGEINKILFIKNSSNIILSRNKKFNYFEDGMELLAAYKGGILPYDLRSFYDSSYVEIWNPYKGKKLFNFESYNSKKVAIAMHPKKNTFLITDKNKHIVECNINDGFKTNKLLNNNNYEITDNLQTTVRRKSKNNTTEVLAIRYSNDGNYMAYGGKGKHIIWWNFKTNEKKNIGHFSSPINAIAISSDKKYLATASGKKIQIWDIEKDSLWHSFQNKHSIFRIEFSKKDDKLITVGRHDAIKIWSIPKKEFLVNLITVGKKDYICLTKDLYYQSSIKGAKGIGVIHKRKVYPIEQYRLSFERPEKIVQTLNNDSSIFKQIYTQGYKHKLEHFKYKERNNLKALNLPRLDIVDSEKIKKRTRKKSLIIRVESSDRDHKLERLNLYVNDVPIYGSNGYNLKKFDLDYDFRKILVDLSSGINKIRVSCINEKGVESLKDSFKIYCANKKEKPTLHFITICNSRYKNRELNSPDFEIEAKNFIEKYKEKATGFKRIEVYNLFNKKHLKRKIASLRKQLEKCEVDDKVVVYIKGHAIVDGNLNYWFANNETNFNKPSSKSLSFNSFMTFFDAIPSRKKVMLTDVCLPTHPEKNNIISKKNEFLLENGIFATIESRKFKQTIQNKINFEQAALLISELNKNLNICTGTVVISSVSANDILLQSQGEKQSIFSYTLDNMLNIKRSKLLNTEKKLKKYIRAFANGEQIYTGCTRVLGFDFGL